MDDSEPQFALTRYSRDLWNELAGELPQEAEFERRGTIWVAADDEEMAVVSRKAAFCSGRGVRAQVLNAKALAEAEPNLRPGLAGGLLIPDDAVMYAPAAAAWLIRRSAPVRVGKAVTEVRGDGVILADGTRIGADVVVCAAGADAVRFVPHVPVRPRKGHLAITDRYPGFVRHQLVELGYLKSAHGSTADSAAFNVQPRATGQVLIGSSRQFGDAGTQVDAAMLRRMLRRALEYMPALASLSVIRTWTGFRAATEDHLPVIGPCPGRPNLYLATGHEGLGITMALGTARIVADLVVGRRPAIDAEAYLPARFLTEPVHA
jgi:glycine/D-amino acid oxidase-like deaminating enzyme